MFGILFFAGAGLASMWGVRTSAGLLVGGEVVKGRLLKHEVKRAFELDLNPERGANQSFGVIEIGETEVPAELHDFVGKYVFSKEEATLFLAALQDRMSGTGDVAAGYDFVRMLNVQKKRGADRQFKKLLQN